MDQPRRQFQSEYQSDALSGRYLTFKHMTSQNEDTRKIPKSPSFTCLNNYDVARVVRANITARERYAKSPLRLIEMAIFVCLCYGYTEEETFELLVARPNPEI